MKLKRYEIYRLKYILICKLLTYPFANTMTCSDSLVFVGGLQKGLNQIQEDVKTRMKSNPMMYRVQILTSDVRSTWAKNREKLISSKFR